MKRWFVSALSLFALFCLAWFLVGLQNVEDPAFLNGLIVVFGLGAAFGATVTTAVLAWAS